MQKLELLSLFVQGKTGGRKSGLFAYTAGLLGSPRQRQSVSKYLRAKTNLVGPEGKMAISWGKGKRSKFRLVGLGIVKFSGGLNSETSAYVATGKRRG